MDDFRGDVLRSPAYTESELSLGEAHFREAKISQLDMSVLIEEDVLGLEISIDDVSGVEVL